MNHHDDIQQVAQVNYQHDISIYSSTNNLIKFNALGNKDSSQIPMNNQNFFNTSIGTENSLVEEERVKQFKNDMFQLNPNHDNSEKSGIMLFTNKNEITQSDSVESNENEDSKKSSKIYDNSDKYSIESKHNKPDGNIKENENYLRKNKLFLANPLNFPIDKYIDAIGLENNNLKEHLISNTNIKSNNNEKPIINIAVTKSDKIDRVKNIDSLNEKMNDKSKYNDINNNNIYNGRGSVKQLHLENNLKLLAKSQTYLVSSIENINKYGNKNDKANNDYQTFNENIREQLRPNLDFRNQDKQYGYMANSDTFQDKMKREEENIHSNPLFFSLTQNGFYEYKKNIYNNYQPNQNFMMDFQGKIIKKSSNLEVDIDNQDKTNVNQVSNNKINNIVLDSASQTPDHNINLDKNQIISEDQSYPGIQRDTKAPNFGGNITPNHKISNENIEIEKGIEMNDDVNNDENISQQNDQLNKSFDEYIEAEDNIPNQIPEKFLNMLGEDYLISSLSQPLKDENQEIKPNEPIKSMALEGERNYNQAHANLQHQDIKQLLYTKNEQQNHHEIIGSNDIKKNNIGINIGVNGGIIDNPNQSHGSQSANNLLDFEKSVLAGENSMDRSVINIPDMVNPFFNMTQGINTSSDNLLREQRLTANFDNGKKMSIQYNHSGIINHMINETKHDELDTKNANNSSSVDNKDNIDQVGLKLAQKDGRIAEKIEQKLANGSDANNMSEQIKINESDENFQQINSATKRKNKAAYTFMTYDHKNYNDDQKITSDDKRDDTKSNNNLFGFTQKSMSESFDTSERFSANFPSLMSSKKPQQQQQQQQPQQPQHELQEIYIVEDIKSNPVNKISITKEQEEKLNIRLKSIPSEQPSKIQEINGDEEKYKDMASPLEPQSMILSNNTNNKSKNEGSNKKQIIGQNQGVPLLNEELKNILDSSGISIIQEKDSKWKIKLNKESNMKNLDDMKIMDFERMLNDQSELSNIQDISRVSLPIFKNLMFAKDKDSSINTSFVSQKNEMTDIFDSKPPISQNFKHNKSQNQLSSLVVTKDYPSEDESYPFKSPSQISPDDAIRKEKMNLPKKAGLPRRGSSNDRSRSPHDGQKSFLSNESGNAYIIKLIEKLKRIMKEKKVEGFDLDQLLKNLMQDNNQNIAGQTGSKSKSPILRSNTKEKVDDSLALDDLGNFSVRDVEILNKFLDISSIQTAQQLTDEDFGAMTNPISNRFAFYRSKGIDEKEIFRDSTPGKLSPFPFASTSRTSIPDEPQTKPIEVQNSVIDNFSPNVTSNSNLGVLINDNNTKQIEQNIEENKDVETKQTNEIKVIEQKEQYNNIQEPAQNGQIIHKVKDIISEVKGQPIEDSSYLKKNSTNNEYSDVSIKKNSLINTKDIKQVEVQTEFGIQPTINRANQVLNLKLLPKDNDSQKLFKKKAVSTTIADQNQNKIPSGELKINEDELSSKTKKLFEHVDSISENLFLTKNRVDELVTQFRLSHEYIQPSQQKLKQSNIPEEKAEINGSTYKLSSINGQSSSATLIPSLNTDKIPIQKDVNSAIPQDITRKVDSSVDNKPQSIKEVKSAIISNNTKELEKKSIALEVKGQKENEESTKAPKKRNSLYFKSEVFNFPKVEDAIKDSKKIVDLFFKEYFPEKENKISMSIVDIHDSQVQNTNNNDNQNHNSIVNHMKNSNINKDKNENTSQSLILIQNQKLLSSSSLRMSLGKSRDFDKMNESGTHSNQALKLATSCEMKQLSDLYNPSSNEQTKLTLFQKENDFQNIKNNIGQVNLTEKSSNSNEEKSKKEASIQEIIDDQSKSKKISGQEENIFVNRIREKSASLAIMNPLHRKNTGLFSNRPDLNKITQGNNFTNDKSKRKYMRLLTQEHHKNPSTLLTSENYSTPTRNTIPDSSTKFPEKNEQNLPIYSSRNPKIENNINKQFKIKFSKTKTEIQSNITSQSNQDTLDNDCSSGPGTLRLLTKMPITRALSIYSNNGLDIVNNNLKIDTKVDNPQSTKNVREKINEIVYFTPKLRTKKLSNAGFTDNKILQRNNSDTKQKSNKHKFSLLNSKGKQRLSIKTLNSVRKNSDQSKGGDDTDFQSKIDGKQENNMIQTTEKSLLTSSSLKNDPSNIPGLAIKSFLNNNPSLNYHINSHNNNNTLAYSQSLGTVSTDNIITLPTQHTNYQHSTGKFMTSKTTEIENTLPISSGVNDITNNRPIMESIEPCSKEDLQNEVDINKKVINCDNQSNIRLEKSLDKTQTLNQRVKVKMRTQVNNTQNIQSNKKFLTKEFEINTDALKQTYIKPDDGYLLLKPNVNNNSTIVENSMLITPSSSKKIFGFKKKSTLFQRDYEERKATTDHIDILCLKCDQYIKLNEAEEHKENCKGTSNIITTNNNNNNNGGELINNICNTNGTTEAKIPEPVKYVKLTDLNNKLSKIIHLFTDKISTLKNKDLLAEGQKILNIAYEVMNNNDNLEEMQKQLNIVNDAYVNFTKKTLKSDEIFLLILLQRLLGIIKEKQEEIDLLRYDSIELLRLQNEIKAYEKEATKQKAELEIWKYQADILNMVKKADSRNLKYVKGSLLKDLEVLSQINSDIDISDVESNYTGVESDYTTTTISGGLNHNNNNDLKNSFHSGISSTNNNSNGIVPLHHKSNIILDPIRREALRRQFYAEACYIKLNLPVNHPAKDILVSELYDECIKAGIKQEDWGVFIKSRFQIKI